MLRHNWLQFHILVDDVFVRKDLYEGKYAPDMKEHERLMDNLKQHGSFHDADDDKEDTSARKEEL